MTTKKVNPPTDEVKQPLMKKVGNLFYDLPEELIRKIYSYDSTYRDIFFHSLESMPRFRYCYVKNQYTNEVTVYEYKNIYNYFVNFSPMI